MSFTPTQAPDFELLAKYKMTEYAHGGGCACKIPPGELEEAVAGLVGHEDPNVIVGLDDGDDASAVRIADGKAVISTADFFTPVVNNAYDWGRIAAANALSDVYAMGGTPITAINLLGWPRDVLPNELMREVLHGGLDVAKHAGIAVTGGHSIDSPEPTYGMAVTGLVDEDKLMRNDAAQPGLPITLTKPIGVGILNNRHKATGEEFPEAVTQMVSLNKQAAQLALDNGVKAATDVTGFGLLGHLYKMMRASGISATIDPVAVPFLEAAVESIHAGYVSGGSKRNLDWVKPHVQADGIDEETMLLLADAQTSGGLLVIGEITGYPIIGYTTEGNPGQITVK